MQLKVKQLKSGRESTIEVEESMSVLELKRILIDGFDIPVAEQSVVFKGKVLLDPHTLDSYGIKDGNKLFITHKPRTMAAPASTSSGSVETEASPEPMETGGGREERLVLNVKILKGGKEEIVEVESDKVTVQDVKRILELRCDIPTYQQSLVVAGKALADSQRLCDYNIKSGTNIFLAQKTTPPPPGHTPRRPIVWSRKTDFLNCLQAYLQQHFSDEDADKIVYHMEEELMRRVYDVNLDTIEALANRVSRNQGHMPLQ